MNANEMITKTPLIEWTEELRALPALSIRQPWAWMILHAGKDIENRNWYTGFRGDFLIHAAKGGTRDEYTDAVEFARFEVFANVAQLPGLKEIERGGVVGVATVVNCVRECHSRWFMGRYGFVLKDVRRLPFTPCKGALGFFKPELLPASNF